MPETINKPTLIATEQTIESDEEGEKIVAQSRVIGMAQTSRTGFPVVSPKNREPLKLAMQTLQFDKD